MNSAFGQYNTRKFSEIYETASDFTDAAEACQLDIDLTTAELTTVYYLLYARYGNSSIVNYDENQWNYKLWAILFNYGPTWSKELSIQTTLRGLTEDQIRTATRTMYNSSLNPSTLPSNGTDDELTTINSQNVTKGKKGVVEGYAMLLGLLDDKVTDRFIDKFKNLFLTIVEPQALLLYGEEES